MNFAYLIAAHHKADQLKALLDKLLRPGTGDFAILHLDRKSTLWTQQRDQFANHPSNQVHVIEQPVNVRWGHKSQLDATLKMLDAAIEKGFTVAHHISGVDWPIASRANIVSDIEAFPDAVRVEIVGHVQADRMQDWWLYPPTTNSLRAFPQLASNVRHAQAGFSKGFTKLASIAGIERSQPYGRWVKGWSWWSVPQDAAIGIAEELRMILRSNRLCFTRCSDEHVIPTIVANQYSHRLANYRRYVNWEGATANPNILTQSHLPAIRESGAWFARKFDADIDDFFLTAFPD